MMSKIDPNIMTYTVAFKQWWGRWKYYTVHSHEIDEIAGNPRIALKLPDDSVLSVPLGNREYRILPDYANESTRVRLHRDHIAQAASELAHTMVKMPKNRPVQEPQEPRVFDTPARQVSM